MPISLLGWMNRISYAETKRPLPKATNVAVRK
jgi:hypothetical protein